MNQASDSRSSSFLWLKIMAGAQSEEILTQGITRVAQSLSGAINRPMTVGTPKIEAIPIHTLLDYIGDPEVETVGVYLLIEGDLQGQALLMFDLADALYLVDALTGNQPGTTTWLEDTARKEIGNLSRLMLAAFLEVVSDLTRTTIESSPPAVMVDMAGAIIDVVAATSIVANSDNLVVIEADFKDADKSMQCRFWILPDPGQPLLEF